MKFLSAASFLAILGLALTAPSYHHDDHHHHASSYAVVTKHDSHKQQGWEKKDWAPHGIEHHSDDSVAVEDHGHHDGDWYKHDDYDAHAKYEFDYGVKDSKTGDIKNQWEHRDGDHVKGGYSLKEADGTTRVVEYTADDHKGFNAVVKKIGHAEHPVADHIAAHHAGWEADSGSNDHHSHDYGHDHGHIHSHSHGYEHGHEHGYGHGHDHGHATSYVKVEQH